MWTYAQAIEAARAEIDAGHAIAYCTGHTRTRGRYVEIETAQGWNPDPLWQEFTDDTRPGGANDTNPDQ
jgi:hypothetical protein